jgi:hypothetical protein
MRCSVTVDALIYGDHRVLVRQEEMVGKICWFSVLKNPETSSEITDDACLTGLLCKLSGDGHLKFIDCRPPSDGRFALDDQNGGFFQ